MGDKETERLRAQIVNLEAALVSRDVIGQAKGLLMAARTCSAVDAFAVLVERSQHENRKLAEIAAEIASRAEEQAVSVRRARRADAGDVSRIGVRIQSSRSWPAAAPATKSIVSPPS